MRYWQKKDPFDRDLQILSAQLKKYPLKKSPPLDLKPSPIYVSQKHSSFDRGHWRITSSWVLDFVLALVILGIGVLTWFCWQTLLIKKMSPPHALDSFSALNGLIPSTPLGTLLIWSAWMIVYIFVFRVLVGKRLGLYLVDHLTHS